VGGGKELFSGGNSSKTATGSEGVGKKLEGDPGGRQRGTSGLYGVILAEKKEGDFKAKGGVITHEGGGSHAKATMQGGGKGRAKPENRGGALYRRQRGEGPLASKKTVHPPGQKTAWVTKGRGFVRQQ